MLFIITTGLILLFVTVRGALLRRLIRELNFTWKVRDANDGILLCDRSVALLWQDYTDYTLLSAAERSLVVGVGAKRSETNSHQRRSYEWTASESSTRALTTIVVVKRMWVIYEESDVCTGWICIIEIFFGFCFSSAAAATEDDDDLIADFMLDLFDGG